MTTTATAPDPPGQSRPPRRIFRTRDERAADKAAARARAAQAAVVAQRARDQREAERIKARQERKRLRAESVAERRDGAVREKGDARNTDLLTRVAALIATIVAGQGMWQFLDRVIGDVHWSLRLLMFAFLEVAVITSAIRARSNMRKNFSAGVDGIAVWALTSSSAVLAAMEARSLPEAVFRLLAPLVAAWLWERGMAIERHRIRGTKGINWRLTPERFLVRIGLAESRDRTASEVDTHRRLKRVALAAKKEHQLRRAGAKQRRIAAAVVKRDRALDLAVAHTDLATNPRTQEVLLDLVAALGGADSLSDILGEAKAPWQQLDHPAVTGAAKHREAVQLAEAMREWTDAIKSQRDPEVSAAITSMAAYIAGRDAIAPTAAPTMPVTPAVASPAADVTANGTSRGRDDVGQHAQLLVIDSVTNPVTADASDSDETGDSDRDSDGDRKRPDDQDNREAEEWIRRRCRGRNGVGRKPTQTDVNNAFGFSPGWARNRISEVQSRMLSQGYRFEPDGTVYAPTRSGSDADTSDAQEEVSA